MPRCFAEPVFLSLWVLGIELRLSDLPGKCFHLQSQFASSGYVLRMKNLEHRLYTMFDFISTEHLHSVQLLENRREGLGDGVEILRDFPLLSQILALSVFETFLDFVGELLGFLF